MTFWDYADRHQWLAAMLVLWAGFCFVRGLGVLSTLTGGLTFTVRPWLPPKDGTGERS